MFTLTLSLNGLRTRTITVYDNAHANAVLSSYARHHGVSRLAVDYTVTRAA